MEKQTPYCKLSRVFELIDAELVRATTPVGETDLYIKLTVIDDVLIVSFKEQ